MNFKSLHEERESLKVIIHILECLRNELYSGKWIFKKCKPLKYWRTTLENILDDFPSVEHDKIDNITKEFKSLLQDLLKEVEHQGGSEKETNNNHGEAGRLIDNAIEKYSGMLAVGDAILLQKPEELEDQISDAVDKYFFRSKFFKFQVMFIGAVIAFSGVGAFQLFSGADRAGEIVHKMNERVFKAETQIEAKTKELDELLKQSVEGLVDKEEVKMDAVTKVVADVISHVEREANDQISEKFEADSAENRVNKAVNKIIDDEIKSKNIKIKNEINTNVANRVALEFESVSIADEVNEKTSDKVNQEFANYPAALRISKAIDKKLNDAGFNKEKIEGQLLNTVEKRIDAVFDSSSVAGEVEEYTKKKFDASLVQNPVREQVAKSIERNVENEIQKLEINKKIESEITDQSTTVLQNYVKEKINPAMFSDDEMAILIKKDVEDRINNEIGEEQLSKRVDDVIDKRVRTITERNEENIEKLHLEPLRVRLDKMNDLMNTLDGGIESLERRVQAAERDTQSTIFTVWDNSGKSLKITIIFLYPLFIGVILFLTYKLLQLLLKLKGNIWPKAQKGTG